MNSGPGKLLSVRNLVVEYGPTGPGRNALAAVRDVSLNIEPAGIFALVGESGSGKTSLANAVLQLIPQAAGRVMFQGQDLAEMSALQLREARRNIQAVFQDPLASLSPRRTVQQSLLEPLNHFHIGDSSGRKEQVGTALATVGLDPGLRQRYPHELSGGQRQRVALARALVSEPKLIIADEPLSSLDVSVQARIIELILNLREKLGIAFLFVSHDLSVVRQLADTVAVMYSGRLVETAPAQTLFSRPAHPYTKSLLRAVPVADPGHPAPSVLGGEPPSALTPPVGCVFHMRCSERIERCLTQEPIETDLGFPDETSGEGQEAQQSNHRVRCHLWKS